MLLALLAAGRVPFLAEPAHAHESIRAAFDPSTRYEHFLLAGCTPCVAEAHRVATLQTGVAQLTAIPRSGPAQPGRAGEVRVEVLRARELRRPSRQLLALRMTLSVVIGVGGELFRVATGIVDEDEVAAFSAAISDLVSLADARATGSAADLTDASARGGTLRVGLLRLRGESVAYAQAGDLSVLALRAVWDVPTTIYLPSDQLAALAGAISLAAVKIRELRGGSRGVP